MNFLFLETIGYESALRLSGHHYARLLGAAGHRVLSVSSPVTPFHVLYRQRDNAIRRRFEQYRLGFAEVCAGVRHWTPMAWIPIRKSAWIDWPVFLRASALTYKRDLLGRLREMDFSPDVLSIQSAMFQPVIRWFPQALVHYRIEDLLEGFPDVPASLLWGEMRLIERANIVSITSRQLEGKLPGALREKMLLLPNGVDAAHFRAAVPAPEAYRGITKPIVLYVGALRSWFDWDLLRGTIELTPEAHFFVVSPDGSGIEPGTLKNFTYVPGVPYEQIAGWYQHAAAGIIPFRRSPLVDAVSPIKLFEFLAAGTPVITVPWKELSDLNAPVTCAETPGEFAAAIREIVRDRGKRDYAEFISRHSWQANVEALLERIDLSFRDWKK